MSRLLLLMALQVGAILSWAGYEDGVRATSQRFRVPLLPADPYDLVRGRYFRLNPTDARIKTGTPDARLSRAEVERFLSQETYFSGFADVGFCPEDQHQRVCALARPAADGEPLSNTEASFWSRATVTIDWEDRVWRRGESIPEPGWVVSISLGTDRFFLPNRLVLPAREADPGWELELAHRPGRNPLPVRLLFKGQPVFES